MPSCAALSEKGTISSDWLKKALLAPAKLSGPENLGSTASSETFLTILLWLPYFFLVELQIVTPLKLFTGHDLIPTLAHVKPLLVAGLEVTLNHRLSGFNLRWIKPHLTDSPKGPWELVWHAYLDYFGEDQYNTFVWGKVSSEKVLGILIFIQKW